MLRDLKKRYQHMNSFSKNTMLAGFYLMDLFYLLALLVHSGVLPFRDYLDARQFYFGVLELAPALLALCVCSGVICDFIYRHYTDK